MAMQELAIEEAENVDETENIAVLLQFGGDVKRRLNQQLLHVYGSPCTISYYTTRTMGIPTLRTPQPLRDENPSLVPRMQ